MARTNNTLYAVLGILSGGPRSGYDIRKQFQASLRHFWSESYGQIYPALKELVRQGYAEELAAPDNRRNKKLYRMTPAGDACFRSWLSEPVSPINYRDELLLKVFFAAPQDRDAIRALFERERAELEQAKAAYAEQEAEVRRQYEAEPVPYWMLTLRYGILSTEARLQWCEEALSRLSRE